MPWAVISWSRAVLRCGGEAGPVWVEIVAGLDGLDHGDAQQLIERQQRPDLLFDSGAVSGAQDRSGEQGVAQCEVSGLDLPAFVIKPDQPGGGKPAVVEQGGDQSVVVAHGGAIGAAHP